MALGGWAAEPRDGHTSVSKAEQIEKLDHLRSGPCSPKRSFSSRNDVYSINPDRKGGDAKPDNLFQAPGVLRDTVMGCALTDD